MCFLSQSRMDKCTMLIRQLRPHFGIRGPKGTSVRDFLRRQTHVCWHQQRITGHRHGTRQTEMSGCEDSEAANAVRLFPRRKVGDRQAVAPEKGRLPVSFDLRTVGAFFSMPQAEAAQELGISLTALKQVCRKLGVVRWPYRRPKKRGSLSKDAAAGSCLHPVSGAPSLSAAAVHVTDDDVASSCETTDECMSDSGGSSVSSTTSSPRRETKYARLVADVDFQRPGVVAVAPDGESPCDERPAEPAPFHLVFWREQYREEQSYPIRVSVFLAVGRPPALS